MFLNIILHSQGVVMETLVNFVTSNSILLIGAAAVMCGVALLYLVMSRTMKRRDPSADAPD
ncbi:hypothetical protein HGD85_03745 [Rhodobacteraceae bacterium R_SAG10]|nr:hypothetical protein [Rhodobacteraceae bacterium R_SAG10]